MVFAINGATGRDKLLQNHPDELSEEEFQDLNVLKASLG
jgi:hypothetical protein